MVYLIPNDGKGIKKDLDSLKKKEKGLKQRGIKKKPLLFIEPEKTKESEKTKPEHGIIYKEGPTMTKCEGVWVKREFAEGYGELKMSLENRLLEPKEKKLLLMRARRNAHKALRKEILAKEGKKPKKSKKVKSALQAAEDKKTEKAKVDPTIAPMKKNKKSLKEKVAEKRAAMKAKMKPKKGKNKGGKNMSKQMKRRRSRR